MATGRLARENSEASQIVKSARPPPAHYRGQSKFIEGQFVGQGQRGVIHRQIQALFHSGTAAGLPDQQLLERFTTQTDEDAGRAFAALVQRHGSTVLRVCRGVLRDPHDAEDAFQATFLVLANRARSIRRRDSVGSWLYGVALRVAAEMRSGAARRRAHERRAAGMKREAVVVEDEDSGRVVLEEVGRLPERLRAAIVLCYLEGRTCEQAADQLGWPVGTVKTRLASGRERLRHRLLRRGLAPSVGPGALLSAGAARAAVPASLGESTARAATSVAGRIAAGPIPAHVLSLTKTALRAMLMTRLKMTATAVVVGGLLALGAGAIVWQDGPDRPTSPRGGAGARAPAASGLRHLESLGFRIERIPGHPAKPAGYSRVSGRSRVRDDDLAALGSVERLEELNLVSAPIGDAGLEHLSGLTGLRWLYLARTRITDAGLGKLEPLRGLKILDVSGTAVGDAGLERIARLGSLVALDLTGTRVTDVGLPALAPLGRLKDVGLSETAVTDAGLEALTAIRPLVSVSLDGCPGVKGPGLRSLAALPKLRVLVLNGSPIGDDAMDAIGTLRHLSELHLEGTAVTDAGLARLRGLKSLRHVYLHGSRCTDEGVKALAAALPKATVTLRKSPTIPDVYPGDIVLDQQPAVAAREPAPFERGADVIYGWKHGMALTMDVLKPRRHTNGAAVVWMVGDGFYSRREMITPEIPWMDELLGRGYHVFVVIHGSTPRFNVEEAVNDVHRAVRFIRHNARSYGIDPGRIGAAGRSGAGHLALMLGMGDGHGWHSEDPIARGELAIHDPIDDESGRVGAVACFYGPTDFRNFGEPGRSVLDHPIIATYRGPFVPREFDDRTRTYRDVTDPARVDEWLARASPVSHASGTSAPVLLFHGEKDENVPLQQSRAMAEALRSAGVACELQVKPGAGHGWTCDPADMARVADWFDRHLRSGR